MNCVDYTESYESEILQLEEIFKEISPEKILERRGIENRLIAVREEFEEWKRHAD